MWKGRVTVKGTNREGTFEIFNSNGAWAMLFGKPLLKTFDVVHDYTNDTICISHKEGTAWTVLTNQFSNMQGVAGKLLANLTVDIKQLIKVAQQLPKTPTTIGTEPTENTVDKNMYKLRGGLTTPLEGSLAHHIVPTKQNPA